VGVATTDEDISFRSSFQHTMLGLIYPICNLDFGAERALTSLITVQLFKSDSEGVLLEYVSDWLSRAWMWALYTILNF
jgi:hypothetical protein